jgi:hypothetical protein
MRHRLQQVTRRGLELVEVADHGVRAELSTATSSI